MTRAPGSDLETWVTERTDHMGDTFGPNGFSGGSSPWVSKSQVLNFTETAVRDRVGTSRCHPSHTAHTGSHGLKSRDRQRNPEQQNKLASRVRHRGRIRASRAAHRERPQRKPTVRWPPHRRRSIPRLHSFLACVE